MKQTLLLLVFLIIVSACSNEFYRILPSTDLPSSPEKKPICQAPAIEKNIVGTWHFESNRTLDRTIRTGSVTFTAQNQMIDPDSLFENYIDTGTELFKVVNKIYTTDSTRFTRPPGFTGKILRVDLFIKNNKLNTIWPLYVASNECNKIIIYQLSDYNTPVSEKQGFTLTR